MIPVLFHSDAQSEMEDAAFYYEAQQSNLGKRFISMVQDAVRRIQITPVLFVKVEGEVRRCQTHTFPFGILYRVEVDRIVVVAVMHNRRDPGYWNRRA
jgi:plasmid stabilization system protein ParE